MNQIERLREAAEWAVEEIDPEGSWHEAIDWEAEGRIEAYIGDADPHTLIAMCDALLLADKAMPDVNHPRCVGTDECPTCLALAAIAKLKGGS